MNAVVARWDGFLAQVRERFVQLLGEANEGCPQLLEQAGGDPGPMSQAWHAIEQRLRDLGTKIGDTWSQAVEAAFEQAGAPPHAVHEQRAKGDGLREWMSVEVERARIRLHADAGRALFGRAISEMGQAFACSRCGVPLQVPFTLRAVNVPCTHCRTLNGFEPGMRVRMVEGFVHPLCEERAWDAWLALRGAEAARTAARPVTLGHLQVLERAQLAYWHAYLSARVGLLPDTRASFDEDLRGRMRAFYDAMDRERPWIEAGRRRALG